jgi:UDP-2-acetamido-3-amino-2,3-dideoxy-glucuronate N-acetyltransferase
VPRPSERFSGGVREPRLGAVARGGAGRGGRSAPSIPAPPALRPASDRAPGLLLGEGVELPDGVEVGGNVIIHAGTVVGDGCRLGDGSVLGKPVTLGARSTASREAPPPLVLGSRAEIGAGAVLVAGASIGRGAVVADQAHVRERACIGEESVVGRGSAVDNDVAIGARVKVQTGCYLAAFSHIEDDVFVGPGVVTMNDHAMGRHAPGEALRGPMVRRACRIGGAASILPAVEIGEEAFIAAGSLVTRSVAPRAMMMGVPARAVREVPDADLIERWT